MFNLKRPRQSDQASGEEDTSVLVVTAAMHATRTEVGFGLPYKSRVSLPSNRHINMKSVDI